MGSTPDFEAWLAGGNEPDDHESSYALWKAVQNEDFGIYSVTTELDANGKPSKMFIKGPGEDTLALLSPKAIRAFEKHIERYKEDDDLDWEGSYEFRRAMAKDD